MPAGVKEAIDKFKVDGNYRQWKNFGPLKFKKSEVEHFQDIAEQDKSFLTGRNIEDRRGWKNKKTVVFFGDCLNFLQHSF